MKLQKIRYTKADGSVSERTILTINFPSNLLRGLDLTDESDKEEILEELESSYRLFLDDIEALGLKGNWRSFKEEGIEYLN